MYKSRLNPRRAAIDKNIIQVDDNIAAVVVKAKIIGEMYVDGIIFVTYLLIFVNLLSLESLPHSLSYPLFLLIQGFFLSSVCAQVLHIPLPHAAPLHGSLLELSWVPPFSATLTLKPILLQGAFSLK